MIELDYNGPRFIVLHHAYRRPAYETTQTIVSAEGTETRPITIPAGYDDEPHGAGVVHHLHGGSSPTLFKTLRMAGKAARDGVTWVKADRARKQPRGRILLFDVNQLPEVTGDLGVFEVPGLADKLTELEFAERQMQLWAARAAALATGKSP